MTEIQSFTAHLDESWADRHSAFTVEQSDEKPGILALIKAEGPMFYAFIELTLKRFVERLTDDKTLSVAETIRHLPVTYDCIGVYCLDEDEELQTLTLDAARPGDTLVFVFQNGDEIIEVYRGVLGRGGLEPA